MPFTRTELPFDPSSPKSLEARAKDLIGKSLSDAIPSTRSLKLKSRGEFGNLLEEFWFYKVPNNSPKPDFEEAGVELKSTPLKRLGIGTVTPKERLVLNMIDYEKVSEEEWDRASFLKKNNQLLLVHYIFDAGTSIVDYKIHCAYLFEIPEEDLAVIRSDWERIVSKIRSGKAHELSESETTYLSACTKSASSAVLRRQPFSTILAKPRAFSFKQSYMRYVHMKFCEGRDVHAASIVRRTKARSFDLKEYLETAFKPFYGLTAAEIAKQLGIKGSTTAKNYHALITRRVLGVGDKDKILEFVKAGVTQRTIRVKRNGMPAEHVSFPAFDYFELASEEWSSSLFRNQLTDPFLFVVYQESLSERGIFQLKKVQLWSMPEDDREKFAFECWKVAKQNISKGLLLTLPGITFNGICHVRPHGRDSNDVLYGPNGSSAVRKSFWLNAEYLKRQLQL